jgi:hypothetical protein
MSTPVIVLKAGSPVGLVNARRQEQDRVVWPPNRIRPGIEQSNLRSLFLWSCHYWRDHRHTCHIEELVLKATNCAYAWARALRSAAEGVREATAGLKKVEEKYSCQREHGMSRLGC